MDDYQGLLLDLDGTLIDSEALHVQVDRAVFDACGIAVPDDLWPTFVGRTSLDVFTEMHTRFGSPMTPGAMVAHKQAAFLEHVEAIRLLDGARDLLAFLRAQKIPTALVTSTERALVTPILAHHGLAFDATITADDVTRTKPDPQPYERGAAALGLDAARCIAVEDSRGGIASARAAGCAVVAITGSFDAETLRATGADAVFDTLADVQAWLTPRLRAPAG